MLAYVLIFDEQREIYAKDQDGDQRVANFSLVILQSGKARLNTLIREVVIEQDVEDQKGDASKEKITCTYQP